MLLVFLAVAPVWSTESLCRTPQECGLADGLCGASDPNARLSRSDPATLCVGFQGQNGGPGKKALFNVQVDHYSTLSVDTCARTTPWNFPARRAPSSQRSPPRRAPPIAPVRTLMGADWNAKEAYSHMWVGVNGRRTIGQRAGVTDGRGTCNATVGGAAPASELPEGVSVCYGWAEHNKPIVLPTNQLATGLTAVIHLDMGRVNRVVWDSSCNLVRMPRRSRARAPTQPRGTRSRRAQLLRVTAQCPESRLQGLTCMPDRTGMACADGAACQDCYAQLQPGTCGVHDAVCAPKVYLAWLGTDGHGQPLLSAGSVLSRFQSNSVGSVTSAIYDDVQSLYDQADGGAGGSGSNSTSGTTTSNATNATSG